MPTVLTITKTPDTPILHPGDPFSFTIVVENIGDLGAIFIQLVDTFADPTQVTNLKYRIGWGAEQPYVSGQPIDLPDIPVHTIPIYIFITGNVAANLQAPAIINNAASVRAVGVAPVAAQAQLQVIPLQADVAVVKTASASSVKTGETLTYTIDVTNNGPDPAVAVKLADTIPASLTNPQYSTDGGKTWKAWTGILDVGNMASGATTQVLIKGTAAVTTDTVIVNKASITADTEDPNPSNNQSTATTTITKIADVAVVKITSAASVKTGETFTYIIDVTNNGPDPAVAVKLADIAASLVNPEYSTDGGKTWKPWTGALDLGTMASGAKTTVLIRGKAISTTDTTIVNNASATADTEDPDPSNNQSTVRITIIKVADVAVTKTTNATSVKLGDQLTYTVKVTNNGPDPTYGVKLSDTIPTSLANPEYSIDDGKTWKSWTGTLDLGTMASGATATVLIRGTVATTTDTTIVNKANVTSTDPEDPDLSNNESTVTTPVVKVADVAVTKAANALFIKVGAPIIYTVKVTNNGPNSANGVKLSDTIPASMTNPEYSTDNGTTWKPWTGTLDLGTMASGATTTVLIRGTVAMTTDTTLVNKANVTSTDPEDPDLSNNEATVTTPIIRVADVAVTKTANALLSKTGDPIIYTVKVTNNGPDPANGVELLDTIPASVTNPEYSTDNGTTWRPWTGTLDLGTMASGATTTVLIRGTVATTTDTTIVNKANVTSTATDPDLSNNSSTVTTVIIKVADLAVTKVAQEAYVKDGECLIYKIMITNNGPDAAGGVVLIDAMPSQLINVEYSLDDGVLWKPWAGSLTVGVLAKGEKKTVLIRGRVHAEGEKVIANTADVISDQVVAIDPNMQNNTDTVSIHVEYRRQCYNCCCNCGCKHYYYDDDYDYDNECW